MVFEIHKRKVKLRKNNLDFILRIDDSKDKLPEWYIEKDQIIKIDTALDKVESIGGYQFVWNNNIGDMRAGTPDYGVIAQELEDVLPHAVDINSRGHKTVNYNSLIPLLIEAVKELSARVKELEPEPEEPEEDIDG